MRQGPADYKFDDYGNYEPDTTPIRYTDDGTKLGYRTGDTTITNGQILFSATYIQNQETCRANTGNSGYWYTWSASTAGSTLSTGSSQNSICPKGWQLSTNTADDTRSYYYLIRVAYNDSSNGDSKIRLLPMSFIRSGVYDNGSLYDRGGFGYYWSSAASNSNNAYHLYFRSGNLNPQDNSRKNYGFSVRCVAR